MALLGSVVERPGPGSPGPALGRAVSVEDAPDVTEPPSRGSIEPELTTVADDEVVVHWPGSDGCPARVERRIGLEPDTPVCVAGIDTRTLPRPPGARLATVATVNDLHFGETVCGVVAGTDVGPVLSSEPGEPPYPALMSEAAAEEVGRADPDLVVARGDLTDAGRAGELEAFLARWQGRFAERLAWVRGNHDAAPGSSVSGPAMLERHVEGLTVALLDTAVPGEAAGRLTGEQLQWLDELAARADRPVLAMGHHPPFVPDPSAEAKGAPERSFGLDDESSAALVALVARRPAIVAYASGHTHRNRVRRFASTGATPWIEVASVKDFPGSWAELRVFDGGLLHVHRRISRPDALRWSDRCRALVFGLYPRYAFGRLGDRCFPIPLRRVSTRSTS